ncbi:MAG: competence protein CoiA family protein [Sphaerochaeta associata]|uniref:competence protein CoiA family protein n=1 Tax=Sphaerochaeta associata TaxID=1129264 RepID=UPI002B21E77C|nr:competence protein CoiA family protein [Sphaerochaeta associata]MEA5028600.1 competence protein CoiA family protein [Sphaerochaeta associata]
MTQNNLKLPCALKNGNVIPIEEAKSGEKGYTCPGCHGDVIVRKGEKRRAHFAHKADSNCATGYQTAIHLLAKEILVREKLFRLPNHSDKYTKEGCYTLLLHDRKVVFCYPLAQRLDLSEAVVKTEERLHNNRIPDIYIEYKGSPLVVEIYVTHKVTDDKIADFQKEGIPIVEIDLSKQKMLSESELKTLLCEKTDHKMWLYNQYLRRISKYIRDWEKSANSGKYIVYTQNKQFKANDELDNSMVFKPLSQNESGTSIVADCPRKIHYSQSELYATEEECKTCPFYVASYELYIYPDKIERDKGVLCHEQESYPKHSLVDFERWLREFAKEEAKKQKLRPLKYRADLHRWIELLKGKSELFIPELAEEDVAKLDFIVAKIAYQTYLEYFEAWRKEFH